MYEQLDPRRQRRIMNPEQRRVARLSRRRERERERRASETAEERETWLFLSEERERELDVPRRLLFSGRGTYS